jgi:cytochrome c peroxidase
MAGVAAIGLALVLLASLLAAEPADSARRALPRRFQRPNPAGVTQTLSTTGPIDLRQPFFQGLGTNGRSCATCHAPEEGWSFSAAGVRARFERSDGQDPIFRPVDGSVSPLADVSTPGARRAAYRLLLERGLVRIGLPVPPEAEFVVDAVEDPYGYASAQELSLFRRPLPATNLKFLTTVMWDGRETHDGATMAENLTRQAEGAVLGHAEGTRPLTAEEREAIVGLETGLLTVQFRDREAGRLPGDTRALLAQPFAPGINTAPFGPAFALFAPWSEAGGPRGAARRAIARGAAIFDGRGFGRGGVSCAFCHNAPGAGSSSTGALFDLGLSGEAESPPGLPVYTLRCLASGAVVRTTDPGRALVTGRCGDIDRFKVPALRGLAARAPYFHNGAARTLEEVVAFYDRRFAIGLTPSEAADLAAFLRAL